MSFDLAPLQNLIDQFERMQGIGHKTAKRMAFYVLGLSYEQAREFAQAITDAHTKIKQCKVCCNLADDDLCPICKSKTRDKSTICVVQDPRDVAAIERTHEYNGTYHVLHGAISPMDNIGPDQIRIKELVQGLEAERLKRSLWQLTRLLRVRQLQCISAVCLSLWALPSVAWRTVFLSAQTLNMQTRLRFHVLSRAEA